MRRVTNYEVDALIDLADDAGKATEAKLLEKYHDGYRGWDNPSKITDEQLRQRIQINMREDNYLNVMVLAVILWNRHEPDEEPEKDQEPRKE